MDRSSTAYIASRGKNINVACGAVLTDVSEVTTAQPTASDTVVMTSQLTSLVDVTDSWLTSATPSSSSSAVSQPVTESPSPPPKHWGVQVSAFCSLLRPRQWWRSIVMSTSVCVCLSVCPRASPEPHAPYLPNFCACCLWPWLGPLQRGDEIPRGKGSFGAFLPIDNAL